MDPASLAGLEAQPRPFRFMRRAPVAFALAVGAALLLVGPVVAAQPIMIRNIVDGPHVDVIDCGTFSATLVRNFTGTDIVFLDGQGQPVREQVMAKMVGTLTSDTGTVVQLRGDVLFVIDFAKGTYAFNGQVFMANRPGVGVVIQDTGRYLTDFNDTVLLEAGPHDVIDKGSAAFCLALR